MKIFVSSAEYKSFFFFLAAPWNFAMFNGYAAGGLAINCYAKECGELTMTDGNWRPQGTVASEKLRKSLFKPFTHSTFVIIFLQKCHSTLLEYVSSKYSIKLLYGHR